MATVTTKVFKSGNSQAVRMPKAFRFNSNEVHIERRGNEIVLTEVHRKPTAYGRRLVKLIRALPEDFIAALEEIEKSDRPPEPIESFD
jgi:antitoxin VapB